MKYCPECGAAIRPGTRFCVKCGVPHFIQNTSQINEIVTINADGSNINALIERAYIFLEDEDFARADHYFEQILNNDPKNGKAYVGKLLAELKVKTESDLADLAMPFAYSENYQKACRFGGDELKAQFEEINQNIIDRNERNRSERIYNEVTEIIHNAADEHDYLRAVDVLKQIPEYRDAASLEKECMEKADTIVNERIYDKAKGMMDTAEYSSVYAEAAKLFAKIPAYKDAAALEKVCAEKEAEMKLLETYRQAADYAESSVIPEVEEAIVLFESIPDYEDVKEKIEACKVRIEELKAEEARLAEERLIDEEKAKAEAEELAKRLAEEKAKKRKKIIIGSVVATVLIVVLIVVFVNRANKQEVYDEAVSAMDQGKYALAIESFESLGGFKDSENLLNEAKLELSGTLIYSQDYELALTYLEEIKDIYDVDHLIEEAEFGILKTEVYELCEKGDLEGAADLIISGNYSKTGDEAELLADMELLLSMEGEWKLSSGSKGFMDFGNIRTEIILGNVFTMNVYGDDTDTYFACEADGTLGEFVYSEEKTEKVKVSTFDTNTSSVIQFSALYGSGIKYPGIGSGYELVHVTYYFTWFMEDGKLVCEMTKEDDSEVLEKWVYEKVDPKTDESEEDE